MHLKRQKAPKNWPIKRKGTAYIVRPNFNIQKGLPILIILRDILKITQNRREAKNTLHAKHILLNNKIIRDEKNIALLFDVIKIIPLKKYYRMDLSEKGKFIIKEIKESESNYKISKIINKKTLKGKKIQLNLSDGKNFLLDIKCNPGDSVLINLEKGKIEKCLPLTEKKKVIIFAGKHSGERGVINKIDLKNKMVELNINKKTINVLIKQIMVIE